MKFEKIKPGMTLYDVRRASVFSSSSKYDVWPVRIISVDAEKRTALASWNGNPPRTMTEKHVTKFRASKPKGE